MDYKVITTCNEFIYTAIEELEKEIKQYLKQGWKLQGGVNMFVNPNFKLYVISQAIYK